jgi:hypothetical protein
MGREHIMHMMPQFNDDLFQCPDGTLISKSTGKILIDNTKTYEFPSEKMRMVKAPTKDNCWNDNDIYNFNPVKNHTVDVGLSKDDVEYAELSKQENEKLKTNMSDLQKQLLFDLENGRIFKNTKLIEEN